MVQMRCLDLASDAQNADRALKATNHKGQVMAQTLES